MKREIEERYTGKSTMGVIGATRLPEDAAKVEDVSPHERGWYEYHPIDWEYNDEGGVSDVFSRERGTTGVG